MPKLTADKLRLPSTFPIAYRYNIIIMRPTSKNDRKNRRACKKFVDFLKQSTQSTSKKKKLALSKNGKGQLMISKHV